MHIKARRGERQRRISAGRAHAEKLFAETVWFPAAGSFEFLHPEYEVSDFKDGTRYLDFAYVRAGIKVCIEIDGFSSHGRDADRVKFSDDRTRQNHLVIDGWTVLRFSYDDIKEKPRQCQQIILLLLGKLLGNWPGPDAELSYIEKEAVRFAALNKGLLIPGKLCVHLRMGRRRTMKLIGDLVDKDWLAPATGTSRIRSYRLKEGRRFTL